MALLVSSMGFRVLKKIESGSSVDRLERLAKAVSSPQMHSSLNSLPNPGIMSRSGHLSTSKLPSKSRVSFAGEDLFTAHSQDPHRAR